MTPSRWVQIKAIFYEALEKPENEREAFLSEACSDDSLQREVRELLAAEAGNLLESPVAGILTSPARPRALALPSVIGRYRIVRLLGEGGMGAVYKAEQDHPLRTVALKVIKPGLAGPGQLRRFEHESQMLGRLQHPGIAQIYEAGAADSGFGPQPYFAMEFIQGDSLLRYADAHQLITRERLALMVKVCEAVHHAHQRGIIHRDLKPGNILVDETGQPKILDFGVARATDADARATRQTDSGQLVGTLAYMSPEQVLADPMELDTRSDVYALGVILFELLTGRLPYEITGQVAKMVQTIREEDATRLGSVDRAYRGDIETIATKALEKDKNRRYSSAAELAADIQRYLKDEPIVARRSTATYQLRKFARRHRGLAAGVAVAFVTLIAGLITSSWEAARALRAEQEALRQRDSAATAQRLAQKERDRALDAEHTTTAERNRAVEAEETAVLDRKRADAESATAKAINEFLEKDLLAQASAAAQARPGTKPDPDLKVRTALDRAASRISGRFDQQPLVEASIRQTIGKSYQDLGLYADAQSQLQRALELRQRALGEDHRDTLDSMHSLATLFRSQGNYAKAEPLFRRVLEIRRRMLGEWHPDTLQAGESLAMLYGAEGDYTASQSLYTHVLEGRRRALGWEHLATLSSMNDLAGVYERQVKYAEAEPLLQKVLEVRRRVFGPDHPDTLTSMYNLGRLYREQHNYARAEPLLADLVPASRRVLGDEHPNTQHGMRELAIVYASEGRLEMAEPLFSQVLEVERRVLGEEHPSTLSTMYDLAKLYLLEGREADAEPLLAKTVELKRRVLGENDPSTVNSMVDLGILYRVHGKYREAEPIYTKILEVQRKVRGEEHIATLSSMQNLAILYRYQGRYAEAETLLMRVLEAYRRVLGSEHPVTRDSLSCLAELRLAQQRHGEAESLLRQSVEGQDEKSADAWKAYDRRSLLGLSLMEQKKYAEAEPWLISGYQGLLQRKGRIDWPSRSSLVEAGERIVRLYHNWGKPEKAAEWRERLRTNAAPTNSAQSHF